MKITIVPTDQAQAIWPEIAPYVKRAIQYDPLESINLEDLERQVGNGLALILIAAVGAEVRSATIVQLFDSTDGRVLHVLATAGEKSDDWLGSLIEELDRLADLHKCIGVTMGGRPGWTKKLAKYGFRTEHVTMLKRGKHGKVSKPVEAA